MKIDEEIWDLVIRWNFFAMNTVGKQLMRSADSIAVNIVEGHGR